MMVDKKDTKRSGASLWIKLLLAGSLAVNFVIIGVLTGLVLRGGSERMRPPIGGYAVPYIRALPEDTRRELGKELRRGAPVKTRQNRIAEYRDMIEILRSDPFDAAAAQAILTRQMEDAMVSAQRGGALWFEVVGAMSAQERAVYADRLEEALRRKAGSGGRARR